MIIKTLVLLLFTAIPLFAQSDIPAASLAVREQGLITGNPSWRQALGGSVIALPHVQAQSAVVALDGGNIRAYSTAGTPLWNYSARGRISPYVTRSREGISYFSRTNGNLIALNRAGKELWRRNIGDPLCARIIIGWDGRLFVPVEKKILCYTASGNLLWTRTLDLPFSLAPKLDSGGGIIFALENNEVYRIDPFGNTHVWMLSNMPAVLLSIDHQRVAALYRDGTMEILGSSEDWYIAAHEIEVHSSLLPRLPSGPLAAASSLAGSSGGNNAAVVLSDGRVVYISFEERKILWNGDSHIREIFRNGGRPDLEAEMFIDERGVYILSKDGATCFSHDGRRFWFTFLQNAAAIPAFGDDGVLYSGTKDWILNAYKIEDRVLSYDLYGPAPQGSYGTGTPQSAYMPNFPFLEYETRNMLEQIAAAVKAGRVGANEPAWTTFLLTTGAGRENIQNRIRALNLLGQIGSRETVPWLVNIFRRESEPLIRAAAVSAIGEIGIDPDGIAIQNFLYYILQPNTQNTQLLLAIASATGSICRFSGPPLSETGVRILTLLSETSSLPMVRRQAQRELASLI